MKYVFIVNNKAGRQDNKILVEEKIKKALSKMSFEYVLYLTKNQQDATDYVKQCCTTEPNEEICFVACGGDGTLLEVAEGLVGTTNKCLALFTCGSGNDFAKYYQGKNFDDIEKMISGTKNEIDIIKVNDRYSINVCNLGFEAAVADYANKVKLKGGKDPYTKGIIKAIFTSMKNKIKVIADGEEISRETMLLCSMANNQYAGGKYRCAPLAINDDGLIDVCLFHPISIIKLALIIGAYERGEHLTNPKYSDLYIYRQAKNVKVLSEDVTQVCLDGEIIHGKEFDISIQGAS